MTKKLHNGMIVRFARFHVAFKNQIIKTDYTLFYQLTNIPLILGWKTDDRRPKIAKNMALTWSSDL
ncbi:hypothetical protein CLV31_107120 [Algoriphagus aquaeductus]|uniref:Uncharacterized protein n=1 Tax=Algoriphagus aquaeductus TaxID=475299 RepID=A0A326RTV8_9BACT|nr:hypothetical protein CLV31_107120 [Algoriphagus aquaeductus]